MYACIPTQLITHYSLLTTKSVKRGYQIKPKNIHIYLKLAKEALRKQQINRFQINNPAGTYSVPPRSLVAMFFFLFKIFNTTVLRTRDQ